jgi:hypothetical protein
MQLKKIAYNIFRLHITLLITQDKFSTNAYGMVSFSKQVPNLIILGYEIILAFEIRAFKV